MAAYASYTKAQKVAAFLITVGPDAASEVLKSFENAQLEQVCREIAAMPLIEPDVQRQVLQEFASVVATGVSAAMGGVSFAQDVLERAKGDYAASSIINRCAFPVPPEGGEEIRQMDSRQLLNLIKTEQPQAIAFILSCLEAPKAAEVVAMLSPEQREEVVERLGAMEPTASDSIHKVARNLSRHVDRNAAKQGLHRSDGIKSAADILNALDKENRKTLLTKLEERNATLGAAIRKKVFLFEEIAKLTPSDLQRVLRDVDSTDLTVALKNAKPALLQAILGAMSKRAAEAMKEELDMLPQPKPKDLEAAQDRIIQIVRKLEEAEEITLDAATEN